MYQLDITERFKRAFKKLSEDERSQVNKALKKLVKGRPYPPGLRVKKMEGHKTVWEASPSMSVRITFEFNNPTHIVLRNVGEHDITLKNP